MRKFLIFLIIAVLGGGGAYYYFFGKSLNVNIWTFVPDTSIAVFQPNDLRTLFSDKEDRKILKNLHTIPTVQSIVDEVSFLDSLAKTTDPSGKSLEGLNMLISVHRGSTSGLSLANLYLVEIEELGANDFFANMLSNFQMSGKFEKSVRNYQGYEINEYSDGKITLAYIFYKNFLILSFSPFLVDDAIRMMEKGRSNEFENYSKFDQVAGQSLTGVGRFYINNRQLARLGSRVIDNDALNISSLEWHSDMMHLDLAIDDDAIQFSGFSVIDTTETQYLGAYSEVRGYGFEMKNVVPERATMVLHISGDDMNEWLSGMKKYWAAHNPSQLSKTGELENKYSFSRKRFFELIDHEIGLFLLSTKKSFSREKVLCVKHNDEISMEALLIELSKNAKGDKEEYLETVLGRKIRRLNVSDFPERMFGEIFSEFADGYFFVGRNYLFIGNTETALEQVLADIESDATWRRSVETNRLLETTNEDAVFSVFARGTGFWDIVRENLVSGWSGFFEDYELVMDQLEFSALHFVNVDGDFYTSLSIHHPGKLVETTQPREIKVLSEYNVGKDLITKPFGVKNHNNRSLEMIVQDQSKNLNLISLDGKRKLKIQLKEKVVTPVLQVDYYKNGKLQYLFATPSRVHMIDRTGTYIPGYPVKLPSDQPIKHLSLIDYDGSKNYRILVATEKSFYYLLNKAGKRLKGWNPKKLTGSPAMAGQHIRVKKTDYMLFLQSNGIVHGLNRKGLGRQGFPLDLKGNISSPLFIRKGNTQSTTELVAVNDIGQLLEFDLNGKVIRRDQFPRSGQEEVFQTVRAHNDEEFIVLRKGAKGMTFYRDDLDEMFGVPFASSQFEVQYYSFAKNNEVIVLVDKTNNLVYLYSSLGIMLHREPIESNQKIAMLYHENGDKYEIYYVTGSYLKNATINR